MKAAAAAEDGTEPIRKVAKLSAASEADQAKAKQEAAEVVAAKAAAAEAGKQFGRRVHFESKDKTD